MATTSTSDAPSSGFQVQLTECLRRITKADEELAAARQIVQLCIAAAGVPAAWSPDSSSNPRNLGASAPLPAARRLRAKQGALESAGMELVLKKPDPQRGAIAMRATRSSGGVKRRIGAISSALDSENAAEVGHYDQLRLSRHATAIEVRAAYRRRCMDTHPDKAQGNSENFVLVNKAFTVLSDKEQRAAYDWHIQEFGSNDGLNSENDNWASSLIEEDGSDETKSTMIRARQLHEKLGDSPAGAWGAILAANDLAALNALVAWMRADAPWAHNRPNQRKLPQVTVPNIMLSSSGTKYDVKITFDHYLLIASGTPDLTLAAERRAALSRIRDIWMENRPAPLTMDDLMDGILLEPTMRVRMVFKKRLNKRQILTPVMSNLKKAVGLLAKLNKEASGPPTRGMFERVDRIVHSANQAVESDKAAAVELEAKILGAVEKEVDARTGVAPQAAIEDESSSMRRVRARRAPLRLSY